MTPLPPDPTAWTRGTLTLFPARDGSGHEGTMQLFVPVLIRRWRAAGLLFVFEWRFEDGAWAEGVATLRRVGDASEGTITFGPMPVYVREWRKPAGTVEFEFQHGADAEFEEIARQLGGKVGG